MCGDLDFVGEAGEGKHISLAAIFEGKHISLVICVRGHTYHGETHITLTGHFNGTLGDACEGDSGGPLAIKNNQRWVLAGVISWGDPFGCGIIGKYSVYTRNSVFARWINAHINRDD